VTTCNETREHTDAGRSSGVSIGGMLRGQHMDCRNLSTDKFEGNATRESDDLETYYLSQQPTGVPSYQLLLLPIYGFHVQYYKHTNIYSTNSRYCL
jgi:hypothetical protein